MPEDIITEDVIKGMKYYVIRPDMFVQGTTEEKAWEALSLALGCKISRLKYWFHLIETSIDPNASGV